MSRAPAKVGETRVYTNGYHYTRTPTGWRLTHHLIAEQKLGRPLVAGERAYFTDGDRKNLNPDNIEVVASVGSKERRINHIVEQIAQLEEELMRLIAD